MIIYIDNEYKCYTKPADGLRAIETNFFNGKCDAFIEGYRFIPAGESWKEENVIAPEDEGEEWNAEVVDAEVFYGETAFPWKPYSELASAQEQYEKDNDQMQDMETALAILLGGEVV